jgi:hypothetical protein
VIRHVTYERPELFLLGLPLLGVGLEQVPRPDSLHLLHLNLLTRDSVVRFVSYITTHKLWTVPSMDKLIIKKPKLNVVFVGV